MSDTLKSCLVDMWNSAVRMCQCRESICIVRSTRWIFNYEIPFCKWVCIHGWIRFGPEWGQTGLVYLCPHVLHTWRCLADLGYDLSAIKLRHIWENFLPHLLPAARKWVEPTLYFLILGSHHTYLYVLLHS